MFKNDMKCRACGHPQESQNHILNECKTIHPNNSLKITPHQIFTENIPTLKTTAAKIQQIMKKLLDLDTGNSTSGDPTDQGRRILADLGPRTLNGTELIHYITIKCEVCTKGVRAKKTECVGRSVMYASYKNWMSATYVAILVKLRSHVHALIMAFPAAVAPRTVSLYETGSPRLMPFRHPAWGIHARCNIGIKHG